MTMRDTSLFFQKYAPKKASWSSNLSGRNQQGGYWSLLIGHKLAPLSHCLPFIKGTSAVLGWVSCLLRQQDWRQCHSWFSVSSYFPWCPQASFHLSLSCSRHVCLFSLATMSRPLFGTVLNLPVLHQSWLASMWVFFLFSSKHLPSGLHLQYSDDFIFAWN